MPTITAGASAIVTVPLGYVMDISSTNARVTLGAGPQQGNIYPISGDEQIGPFPLEQIAEITAYVETTYTLRDPQTVTVPGAVDIASMTSAGTAATDGEREDFLTAVGAAQYKAPVTETVDFTLLAESHANRIVYCTKGTAQAITFNTGHGLVDGDSGRIMQVGAGAVTISKDGGFAAGELKLATGVASATTVNDGDILDWEYRVVSGTERLTITFRSAAGTAGTSTVTAYSDGTGAVAYANPGTGETTLASITIPAGAIGANGWVEFLYSVERTAGTGNVTVRLRVANATTGTSISNPSAAARITGVAHFVSQSSTTSHRTSGNGVAGMPFGTVATLTDTTDTAGAVTFYLTGQLATGTETMTKYYFKAVVHNPDA